MSQYRFERLPLQDMALAPSSLKAYNKQLQSFLTHSRLTRKQLYTLPALRIDRALALYIQHSFDASAPFTYSSHALHAVIFHRPDLRLQLHQARGCIKGWEKVKRTQSHPPFTWEIALVISATLARNGYFGPAIGMLLSFDCYLRVSELTHLRRKDIVMPSDARMGRADTGMAVILKHTKTGKNQSVTVQRPEVAQLLCHWVRQLPRSAGSRGLVFNFSPRWFGLLIRNACVEHGLGHIPYVPHSLRHGGATTDFLLGRPVEYIHFRGRWKVIESLRTYIQTARALLAAQNVPRRVSALGDLFSDCIADIIIDAMQSVAEVVPRGRTHNVAFRL